MFAWRRIVLVLLAAAAVGALALAGLRWAGTRAERVADIGAASIARTHAGLLESELQKFRLLPLVLTEYPGVSTVLAGDDPAAAARLDRTLQSLAGRTDAAVLYVIDRSGRTLAASNWRLPSSFVGQNYGFRPYFLDAMRSGSAELFALGTVSGRPGLYLARRVDRDGKALGVIVVKVEFDTLEANWARSSGISLLTDRHGVILITSRPAWRFGAIHALDSTTIADARRTLQFGPRPPRRAPVTIKGATATVDGALTERFRAAAVPSSLRGARLIHLAPLAPPLAAARLQVLIWALCMLIVAGIASGVVIRAADRRRLHRIAHEALEREVAHRTAELRETNARLVIESEERLAADHRYRAAREELAQASRLGSLGQITAGVAHEINQPVAAIRAFAENGQAMLAGGATDDAKVNLARIVALTERVGAITGELRAFVRRRKADVTAVPFGAVIDGLFLLMGERVRGLLTLDLPPALKAACVVGDRIRLEQILVNLVQNALDAAGDRPGIAITCAVRQDDAHLLVNVNDNGPGIDPAVRATLFDPFVSGREDGLGLGLAIARDIARGFGGELALHEGPGGGASFLLTLKRA
ncbi:C4-dicarboxylate transport sensor protein DctB [Sphingomonas sp. EC-HK361]|uniref:sensor histidine kinase n=1 Tax=Sphingomonas sp. EC-HK361 TaxID=2038397 RepID=UPI00125B7626|nr:ATP-binding protein [Sphingomonas sp. EC-HK361]VVS98077.1 C4-dicarboxylate transport sensor protein DctB [Sphingomonas sp. EC-HK361]